jgi:hypothetical protein
MLDPRPDWPPQLAQRLIGEARRRILERYAGLIWPLALAFWLLSFLLGLAGVGIAS